MTSFYLDQIHRNLPRLLASYDTDVTSDTYGVGDRYYWGWKLIDFPNGTFQSAAAGLAGLLKGGLLPKSLSEELILQRIDAIVMGTRQVMSPNGGLSEALPNEGSFCVTGLVAGDLLLAMQRLDDRLSGNQKQKWLDVIEPLIKFLKVQDEYHGIISNHLATNALAFVRWSNCSGQSVDDRARFWVDRILDNQSDEGWFKEYDGADAGYQTWCTSSLATIHKLRPEWGLQESLQRSLSFLSYAAHPDGSFGGIYGSRMTRFMFPAGLEILADENRVALELACFARNSIKGNLCVALDAIDSPNLAPLFNDYVTAVLHEKQFVEQGNSFVLPSCGKPTRKVFKEAGWLVDRGDCHYTVLNLRKGGAGIHVAEGNSVKEITGFVGQDATGKLYSTQFSNDESNWVIEDDCCQLKANMCTVRRPRPDAFRFIILRVISLTVLRSIRLGNWIKRALVYLLITKKAKPKGQVKRSIKLGEELVIKDEFPSFITPVDSTGFKPIHMASMGYWQRND